MTQLEALKLIAERNNGILRPKDVVNEARNEESPLHSAFEWNDGIAAEKYRLHQAENIIRMQVFVTEENKDKVRYFVSLSSDRGKENSGYRITANVMSDAELYAVMKADAAKELRSFQMKFAKIKELKAVFAESEKFINSVNA